MNSTSSMANSLVLLLPKLGLLFLFTFLLSNFTKPITKSLALSLASKGNTNNNKRLSTRLIHYNSLVPHPTDSDYAALAMRSSARHAYLRAKAKGVLVDPDDENHIRGSILPGSDLFFVNISIGTPPIPQLAIMDTGSSLFWVQCEPCKNCKKTQNPIYDPSKSSSFRISNCDQAYCTKRISGSCVEIRQCGYSVKYGGGASTSGVMGYESVTFETSYQESSFTVPMVVFGCGRDNYERVPVPLSSGVFGISADDSSFLQSSELFKNSPRFSYCLGNVSDPGYTYSLLFLGNDSLLAGQETPIQILNGLFFASLEGIKVGDTELIINKDEYKFNVLIDSGTTFNYFHSGTSNALKGEIQKILDTSSLERVPMEEYLCYKGDFRRDLLDFPTVSLRLANETLIELDMEGLFYQERSDLFCLAVGVDDTVPVIGLLAQQYYNVGIDIDASKMYLQSIDCRFIDS